MKKILSCAAVLIPALLNSQSAMATRAEGIDVSSYQGTINWSQVHGAGVSFAWAKATEGTYYKDGYFPDNINNGKAAGVIMGAYDFARPDLYPPATEAAYFWAYAKPYIKADAKSLEPMVDFETFNGHVGTSTYTKWFNDWAADIIADGHAAGVTLKPVIFCSAGSGACDLIQSGQPGGITLTPFIANYNGENLYTGMPWTCCTCCNAWVSGCGTGNWVFWNCGQGSVPGITGQVDLDAYNGTLSQLKANEVVTVYP